MIKIITFSLLAIFFSGICFGQEIDNNPAEKEMPIFRTRGIFIYSGYPSNKNIKTMYGYPLGGRVPFSGLGIFKDKTNGDQTMLSIGFGGIISNLLFIGIWNFRYEYRIFSERIKSGRFKALMGFGGGIKETYSKYDPGYFGSLERRSLSSTPFVILNPGIRYNIFSRVFIDLSIPIETGIFSFRISNNGRNNNIGFNFSHKTYIGFRLCLGFRTFYMKSGNAHVIGNHS